MTPQELLVRVVMDLSLAGDLPGVTRIVRRAARELTGADGATFVLREGEFCHYIDEDAIAPLWKGRRFPAASCISGWAMQHRQATAIEDVFADARIPVSIYEPTFVRSLLMVPIRLSDPLGAIGAYWAQPHRASPEEVGLVQALADTTAVAIENVGARGEARRWRALLSEATDMLWTFDPSRGMSETRGVRKWWAGITGRPERDYERPLAWIDDLHPEDRAEVRSAWAASTATATPLRVTYRLRGRDGSYRHLAVRGVPVTRPDGTHEIVGMTKDVTREREAETEIRRLLARERRARDAAEEARRTLDQHLHRVSDGFVAIDRDWRYIYVNQRATEILGYPREQTLGRQVWALFPQARGSSVHRAMEQALATQQPVFEEGVSPGGRSFENRIYPSVTGLSIFFTDITEARRLHREVEVDREALRHLSRRLLVAQDEERRRISLDLHDDFAQVLTAVKMTLVGLRSGGESSDETVRNAVEIVDRSIGQIRDLSLRLHPPMLDLLGLGPTLRWYVEERLRNTALRAHLSLEIKGSRFASAIENACFRVVQEAVTNALRHAEAREIRVHLRKEQRTLIVAVRDDGRGFEPANARARAVTGGHAGLAGMQERVALAGGLLEISSTPGAGTEIRVRFALEGPR